MLAHNLMLQVVLTTLLKVYVRGGLFEKSRELLNELEALGYAEEEVIVTFLIIVTLVLDGWVRQVG